MTVRPSKRFPLEGDRLWEYVNEDSAVDYSLAIEKTLAAARR